MLFFGFSSDWLKFVFSWKNNFHTWKISYGIKFVFLIFFLLWYLVNFPRDIALHACFFSKITFCPDDPLMNPSANTWMPKGFWGFFIFYGKMYTMVTCWAPEKRPICCPEFIYGRGFTRLWRMPVLTRMTGPR